MYCEITASRVANNLFIKCKMFGFKGINKLTGPFELCYVDDVEIMLLSLFLSENRKQCSYDYF
jgi:hypothetical protein